MTAPDGTGAGAVSSPREFMYIVAEGREIVENNEKRYWHLGSLVEEAGIPLGRPPGDYDGPTLGELATAWKTSRSSASEWGCNHAYYPENLRTFGELAYACYTVARRKHKDMEFAIDDLKHAQEQHMSHRQFVRYLDGIYAETLIKTTDLPPRLQGLVPNGVSEVWITIEKPKEAT